MWRSSEGVTIIEVLLVTVLLGILASISMPAYDSYLAKSRQTEAKFALGTVYIAQQSFAAETGSYTNCLVQAGWGVIQNGKRYYTVGITNLVANNTCGTQ